MAPARGGREASVDRSTEYEDFLSDLAAYHERRGTSLDREPKVGSKRVDLLRLYREIIKRGGYDKVSAEKLAWRKVGIEFNLGTSNPAALAFQLKTVFYKNLAAYEITNVHGREPPPKEILEDLTAKGGNLLNRTLENFHPPASRESGNLVGEDPDNSGDEEHRTPRADRMDIEEPGSGGIRATRGLRQAPPQRVPFQPDISSSRQTRSSGTASSPQPTAVTSGVSYSLNASSNPNSAHFTVGNYEPRPQIPLTLRPVVTPGNNPELFKQRKIMQKQSTMARQYPSPPKGMMLPGSGFAGPNIYIRCLYGLRSGIPEEVDFALHHLVKVSHERGDKYKFEGFPLLAEALLEKALEISMLYYDFKFEVSYQLDEALLQKPNILNGCYGTPDILKRMKSFTVTAPTDGLESGEFRHQLDKINEAALVIRNMVMLEDNAAFLSRFWLVRDFLTIALNLPHHSRLAEFQHNALEIAEQLTKYWSMSAEDPLYTSLLAQLTRDDRGAILTALRAISRISMELEENNRLLGVPMSTIERLCQWILLDDEELINSSLDFLYQYTAVIDNVEDLLNSPINIGVELVPRLSNLLLHGARETEQKFMTYPAIRDPPPTDIPAVPSDLLESLNGFDEPERSSRWLKCCFEEDIDSNITQISLWQAYQTRFLVLDPTTGAPIETPTKILPAADFIKNVSATFANANAQVINDRPQPRFIIKGIRPRHVPVNLSGQAYRRCHWLEENTNFDTNLIKALAPSSKHPICNAFHLTKEAAWNHIMTTHLQVPKNDDGKYTNPPRLNGKLYTCHWTGCTKYATSGGCAKPHEISIHIRQHLPADPPDPKTPGAAKSGGSSKVYYRPPGLIREAQYESIKWYNTAVDEKGNAAGIPLTAILILRNIARNLPKTQPEADEGEDGDAEWKYGVRASVFGGSKGTLWHVFAVNKVLAGYVTDLIAMGCMD